MELLILILIGLCLCFHRSGRGSFQSLSSGVGKSEHNASLSRITHAIAPFARSAQVEEFQEGERIKESSSQRV